MVLRKENGSFGLVVRGGSHEIAARVRPFTVVHIDKVDALIFFSFDFSQIIYVGIQGKETHQKVLI